MFWIGDDVPVGGGEYSESAALLVFRCMESSGSAWESLQGQDNEAQEERRSFQQKYNAFQEVKIVRGNVLRLCNGHVVRSRLRPCGTLCVCVFPQFCKRRDSIHEKYQQRLAVMRKLLRLRQLRCEKALRCDADEVAKALAGGVDVEELEQSVDESEAAVQRLMDCSGELFNFILISDVDPEKLVELGTLQQTPSTEHDEYLRKFFATWQYPRSGDQQDSNEDGDEGSDTVTRRAFDEPEDAHWWQQWER